MILSEGYHFFAGCPLSLVICCCFSSTPSPFCLLWFYVEKKIIFFQKMVWWAGAQSPPSVSGPDILNDLVEIKSIYFLS